MHPTLADSLASTHLLEVRRLDRRWRIVVRGTSRIARNDHGTPVDGGGHAAYGPARRQCSVIERANIFAGRIQPPCR